MAARVRYVFLQDCTYEAPSGDSCVDVASGSCGKKPWQGDGFCDDFNNNAACDWDGGDCCQADGGYVFCSDCACLDCTDDLAGAIEGSLEWGGDDCVDSFQAGAACEKTAWSGDGYCDDGNNVGACDWDGGDCCGGLTAFCTSCLCLDCTAVRKGLWCGCLLYTSPSPRDRG